MQGDLFLLSHISGFAAIIPTFLGLISNPTGQASSACCRADLFPAALYWHQQPRRKIPGLTDSFPALSPCVLVFLRSSSAASGPFPSLRPRQRTSEQTRGFIHQPVKTISHPVCFKATSVTHPLSQRVETPHLVQRPHTREKTWPASCPNSAKRCCVAGR